MPKLKGPDPEDAFKVIGEVRLNLSKEFRRRVLESLNHVKTPRTNLYARQGSIGAKRDCEKKRQLCN